MMRLKFYTRSINTRFLGALLFIARIQENLLKMTSTQKTFKYCETSHESEDEFLDEGMITRKEIVQRSIKGIKLVKLRLKL